MVNGKQMTVVWHVDDLKVSHVDPKEITLFAICMSKKLGGKLPLTVRRGKVHDFLGMDMDWSDKGKVKCSQIKYLAQVIRDFPERITGSASSPASDHLFQVRDPDDPDRKVLGE